MVVLRHLSEHIKVLECLKYKNDCGGLKSKWAMRNGDTDWVSLQEAQLWIGQDVNDSKREKEHFDKKGNTSYMLEKKS